MNDAVRPGADIHDHPLSSDPAFLVPQMPRCGRTLQDQIDTKRDDAAQTRNSPDFRFDQGFGW